MASGVKTYNKLSLFPYLILKKDNDEVIDPKELIQTFEGKTRLATINQGLRQRVKDLIDQHYKDQRLLRWKLQAIYLGSPWYINLLYLLFGLSFLCLALVGLGALAGMGVFGGALTSLVLTQAALTGITALTVAIPVTPLALAIAGTAVFSVLGALFIIRAAFPDAFWRLMPGDMQKVNEDGATFRKKEEEARKREEERKQKEEEAHKREEERKQKEEEAHKREEEERQRKEHEEAHKREEERRQKEEEARKREEERKQKEEEAHKREEERKQKEEEAHKLEEERRQKEEEARKREEERKQKEEEAHKREEERKQQEEENRRRQEEELRKQEQERLVKEEIERQRQEEERNNIEREIEAVKFTSASLTKPNGESMNLIQSITEQKPIELSKQKLSEKEMSQKKFLDNPRIVENYSHQPGHIKPVEEKSINTEPVNIPTAQPKGPPPPPTKQQLNAASRQQTNANGIAHSNNNSTPEKKKDFVSAKAKQPVNINDAILNNRIFKDKQQKSEGTSTEQARLERISEETKKKKEDEARKKREEETKAKSSSPKSEKKEQPSPNAYPDGAIIPTLIVTDPNGKKEEPIDKETISAKVENTLPPKPSAALAKNAGNEGKKNFLNEIATKGKNNGFGLKRAETNDRSQPRFDNTSSIVKDVNQQDLAKGLNHAITTIKLPETDKPIGSNMTDSLYNMKQDWDDESTTNSDHIPQFPPVQPDKNEAERLKEEEIKQAEEEKRRKKEEQDRKADAYFANLVKAQEEERKRKAEEMIHNDKPDDAKTAKVGEKSLADILAKRRVNLADSFYDSNTSPTSSTYSSATQALVDENEENKGEKEGSEAERNASYDSLFHKHTTQDSKQPNSYNPKPENKK